MENQPSATAVCLGADEVLDQERLALLCAELDLAETAEVASLFLDDLPHRCRACEEALSGGNLSGLQREAHSLKGAASSFGLVELEAIARELESAAEAQCFDVDAVSHLIAAADRARCALDSWLNGAGCALERP